MAQPQNNNGADDANLEALGEVNFISFTANPSVIGPFYSSILKWNVSLPKNDTRVKIQLDLINVAGSGEQVVSPLTTETYRLSARAGQYSKFLGTVTVHVDLAKCVTHDTAILPSFLISIIQNQINADTSGIYFPGVPVSNPNGTTSWAPAKPVVWITQDLLHISLHLADKVNNFPDPTIDMSISFGLKVVNDPIVVQRDTVIVATNEDINVDISFPWYAWLVPGAMIGLPIAIDGGKQKARVKASEMINQLAQGLNSFFATPPQTEKHHVRLYVDPVDSKGVFAVTFCPPRVPVVHE